jgi:hypothetical protein
MLFMSPNRTKSLARRTLQVLLGQPVSTPVRGCFGEDFRFTIVRTELRPRIERISFSSQCQSTKIALTTQ